MHGMRRWLHLRALPFAVGAAACRVGEGEDRGVRRRWCPSSCEQAVRALTLALAPRRAMCEAAEAAAAERQLPIVTTEEVAKHTGGDAGVWVILGSAVYDVSRFVAEHPGGEEKIMLAAGKSVEPFWALYRQHVVGGGGEHLAAKPHVADILAPLQVGWLDPKDVAAAERQRSDDDPYKDEPRRHAALRLLAETPCSAESPLQLVADHYLTPSELFFVRNHHPVPRLDAREYTLFVGGVGGGGREYTLEQLAALPKASVTSSIQCGGNRRAALNEVRQTSGNAWGAGAISNASWSGVLLRDLLHDAGLSLEKAEHVQFEGEDGVKASIPIDKACCERGDVLVAYEMNGAPLPPDHGHPVRVVVPGHVGVRNVKWLRRVVASEEESTGVWQRGIAYKQFGPSTTSVEGVHVEAYPAMQEMPVQSAIVSPLAGASVDPDEPLTVKGYAYSGGGRGIARVDVSADGGGTWHTATLAEGASQPRNRAWAWTLWEVELPLPPTTTEAAPCQATLVCKAVDVAHNSQPDSPAGVWNLRGLANNSWDRVRVNVRAAE
eukprot:CAMPEP_0119358582 /NCGR_PEP_ID=MMETSP1334-20130426/6761_1 /TAXON_ID=127549 /ORGANISM="Calcidiscus leptoporus, Strain RCC1130" /LENGTH=549 /DNA_ID=CAMNT_0007373115 /DNA_START=8 /DNA_END=1657 /DNA_ORIENTATION=+